MQFNYGFEKYLMQQTQEIKTAGLSSEIWVISSDIVYELLEKIKAKSKTLTEYIHGNSKRGVLTGLSEAFIINKEQRDILISNDPNSSDLIQPFLLGRDIKPYQTGESKQWLILVPKGFTIKNSLNPGSFHVGEPMHRYGNLEDKPAWKWFSENYPAIAHHLLSYKNKAEARIDKGDFWWELRACDYYDLFKLPKLMYQVFQVKPCFIFDEKGLYCNNSIWFIPTTDLFLVGLLNSKLGWWLISQYCTAIQNGFQLIWKYFCQIPIITIPEENKKPIVEKVNRIFTVKKQNSTTDSSFLEKEIDQLVYALYGLTEEEIAIVENS